MLRKLIAALAATAVLAFSAVSATAQTIKIGYIAPLSGPFANEGDAGIK